MVSVWQVLKAASLENWEEDDFLQSSCQTTKKVVAEEGWVLTFGFLPHARPCGRHFTP